MNRRIWLIGLVICLAVGSGMAGSLSAKVYSYQDLTLQGLQLDPTAFNPDSINAINDAGWIVGSFYDSYRYLPYVWRPGLGRTTLPLGAGYVRGRAYGINNAGQIVGETFLSLTNMMPHYPCLWTAPSQDPTNLYVFPPQPPNNYFPNVETPAYGINDSGQITGDLVFDTSGTILHAARWTTSQQVPINLGTLGGTTSTGRSINNGNQVAGTATLSSGQNRACLWVPGQPPKGDLVSLPQYGYFSFGRAINNQGNVVGKADLTPGLGTGHAFFWDHNNGVAQDICPQDYESDPAGISDANEVVGYTVMTGSQVFYWTPGGVRKDLNKMVVNLPAGVTLHNVKAISRNGKYITGFDSNYHPYLLTARAMPPEIYLLLLQ